MIGDLHPTVFHWHGDTFDIPAGARHVARNHAFAHQAFSFEERVCAVQFHLEQDITGISALLRECAGDLQPGTYVQTAPEIVAGATPERMNRGYDALYKLLDGWAEVAVPSSRLRP
jgi:hypothetical protein